MTKADELYAIAERCEQAVFPCASEADALELGAIKSAICHLMFGRGYDAYSPDYTNSLDAAMSLLPATAENIDLFSFIGPYRPSWGCRFHDTAQLMGKRAAKEQIARMQKGAGWGSELRGPPRIVLEKAIAQHFIEFMCMGARTPALALCAAALKARAATVAA